MGRNRTFYMKAKDEVLWKKSKAMAKEMGIAHGELIERCLEAFVRVRTGAITSKTKVGEIRIVDGKRITWIE